MSKAKSGGGPTMNKNVRTPIRTGPPNTKVISPSAAANIGNSKGNHASDGAGGRSLQRPSDPLVQGTRPQVPMGNEVAKNVGRGGPGAGRTIHATGSQGQHGPVAGSAQPQPRRILSEF
jgi:hypothetical protein